ncbi:hypothetical protein BGX34_010070 [Mortierella sp. NVP85]|nr:hypothetical protein BGX34_010070 [Mortierella sp. NVP85]
MEVTRLPRLTGTSAVEKTLCWEDTERALAGTKYAGGNATDNLLGDSYQRRTMAHCTEDHSDMILDVMLPPSYDNGQATNNRHSGSIIAFIGDDLISGSQVTQFGSLSTPFMTPVRLSQRTSSGDERAFKEPLSFGQVVEFARKNAVGSKLERRLLPSLASDPQTKVLTSPSTYEALAWAIKYDLADRPNEQLAACFQHLKDEITKNNELASINNEMGYKIMDFASKNNGLSSRIIELVSRNNELLSKSNEMASENKELVARVIKLQEEMRQLQIKALDRLVLLQNNARALLTQTYELHEYPIPRLFIVLPQDSSSRNSLEMFSHKFRLYFLCECGHHTKSTNSKIPHHIHLAKHEGYDIARPNEFFQQYGSYVLAILRMLKFGISVAGVAVPAVSFLVRDDAVDMATSSLKRLIGSIPSGMDQAIDYIENIFARGNSVNDEPSGRMGANEVLEGADLRLLETFLKNKDENRVLGNLYRTVTTKGHVKWVCIDHYRENYQINAARAFRNTLDSLEGLFDENIGRVKVKLVSRLKADQFYHALELAKSVYELKLELDWDTTRGDFKRLRDTLAKTCVGVLELELGNRDGPTSHILNRSQRYDPVLGIMQHGSIRLIVNADKPDDSTMTALAKATEGSSAFQDLWLGRAHRLDDTFVKNTARIVAQSELRTIEIWMKGDEGRVHILESIQWKHLRKLEIWLGRYDQVMSVMKALVEGVKKMPEKVDLDMCRFIFDCDSHSDTPSPMPQGDLLQDFIASTSLDVLRLELEMTVELALSLFRLADFSRLRFLTLWARGFGSVDVEAILDGLQHATKLNTLTLLYADITGDQQRDVRADYYKEHHLHKDEARAQ